MIFLIRYDRNDSKVVETALYADSDYEQAERDRLRMELESLPKLGRHEIVVLQAPDKASLRRTHSRYFDTQEVLEDAVQSLVTRTN